MGIYLNPGSVLFERALNSAVYVDKTAVVGVAAERAGTEKRFVSMSRPRRFGKTVALNTLCAYLDRTCDAAPLFEGRAAQGCPGFAEHLNRYDVVRLNMKDMLANASRSIDGAIALFTKLLVRELRRAYPQIDLVDDERLPLVLDDAYDQTGRSFAFLVDEWDAPCRVDRYDAAAHNRYFDWLSTLLKDKPYVAFAYITGILPPRMYGEHSALNMFSEVSMLKPDPYQELFGFTEGEVAEWCVRAGMDADQMRAWYDGYDVGGLSVFNPQSVTEALTRGAYHPYWTSTERFEELGRYVSLGFDGLRERVVRLVAGERVPVDVGGFENDLATFRSADDVLTCLVHLGYLTYDGRARTVRVPNREVMRQFGTTLRQGRWPGVARSLDESEALVAATLAGDEGRVAELVGRAHADAASVLSYNDENSLACALSLAYYAARDTHRMYRELPAGVGFADLVFVPLRGVDAPAIVVELKRDASADSALAQIRDRRYHAGVEGLVGTCLLVGVSYDRDDRDKAHACRIERVEL